MLAKSHLELTELREAEEKLDYLRNQSDFPSRNKWELEAVNADFYLQTKNYDKAIQHLAVAANTVPNREKKIRYNFILAQLHQLKGEFKQAFDLYTKIVKMNPKYEMGFNARINRARCYDSSSGSSESVYKELLKMKKDPKNVDFLDQIYYALAGLSKNEGKTVEEIFYLNLSIKSSVGNLNQKALSYLELAKIYYSKPDYRTAQSYYDSTITNMAKDYPDYPDILTRRNSLTKLVKYMKTIETEDSLQQMAALSLEERALIVDKFLTDEEDQKRKLAQEQQSNQIFEQSKPSRANEFNNSQGSGWYFYNTQATSFGFNEFVKRFGRRKLEDNWKRSKKQSTIVATEEVIEKETILFQKTDSSVSTDAPGRRESMMKSIPTESEDLLKSTNKIIEAFYNIGMIYRELLNDLKASAEP